MAGKTCRQTCATLVGGLLALVAGLGAAGCTSPASSSTSPPSTLGFGTGTTTPPECPPAPAPRCASPAEVGRFVQLARSGLKIDYVGTYRYLDRSAGPATFSYVQTSQTSHLRTSFSYSTAVGQLGFRAIENGDGFYECVRHLAPRQPWSCYGPNLSQGQGAFAEQFSYDLAPDYLSLFQPPPTASVITTRSVAGRPSSCLSYTVPAQGPQVPGTPSTWCITSTGVLDHFDGLKLFHPIELIGLTMGERPSLLALPARPLPWPGVALENRYAAFGPPGFAL